MATRRVGGTTTLLEILRRDCLQILFQMILQSMILPFSASWRLRVRDYLVEGGAGGGPIPESISGLILVPREIDLACRADESLDEHENFRDRGGRVGVESNDPTPYLSCVATCFEAWISVASPRCSSGTLRLRRVAIGAGLATVGEEDEDECGGGFFLIREGFRFHLQVRDIGRRVGG